MALIRVLHGEHAAADSRLPYLLRLPLPDAPILKARDTWPRTARVFCHRTDVWPADAEVVEEVPVFGCVRRGVAIDLVLDRPRENRSQFVFTTLPTHARLRATIAYAAGYRSWVSKRTFPLPTNGVGDNRNAPHFGGPIAARAVLEFGCFPAGSAPAATS